MFEVLATNGEYAAGGMRMAPEAEPDDGLFDVVLIGDVTKLDFVPTFPKIYRGAHLSHPKIELLAGPTRGGRVAARRCRSPLDGEQPGTTRRVRDRAAGAPREGALAVLEGGAVAGALLFEAASSSRPYLTVRTLPASLPRNEQRTPTTKTFARS